jgi:anti-sigma regulatory factor (Ser/Thr protein kinase)
VIPDAFGVAALRAAVLQAWGTSPARLREDANAEEDYARGYYRDRVVVELAQNAADAAARAGVPGRLLLRLTRRDGQAELLAANTGAPLDARGVASLASLRASAKRDGDGTTVVGRFGVGFAAVRAVSDDVVVCSTTGAVRFSLEQTRSALAALGADHPELADELRRRDGSLPALRLPAPDDARPPAGYDTAVVLRLRDAAAADEVATLLAAVGDTLLLALPALAEVVVEVDDDTGGSLRRLADVDRRWTVVRHEGRLDLALVADRPVEERSARAWQVTWALPHAAPDPVDGDGHGAAEARGWGGVVHAPTPTDETTSLPALLIATLPLDPSRRHLRRERLTEVLVERAAEAYADLAARVASSGGDPLTLVPRGLPTGWFDAELRERAVAALSRTPLLVGAGTRASTVSAARQVDGDRDGARIPPGRAVAVAGPVGRDPEAVATLAGWAANLVVLGPGQESAARALGVEIRELGDLVDELPAAGDPTRWRSLYAALAPSAGDPLVREALGALPVPLVDGRTVRGARGLVLGAEGLRAATGQALGVLARWGLRLVHPEASHPVLERLGAVAPDEAGLLLLPAVREAVLDVADDDDLPLAHDVAAAVLALVAAVPGDVPASARGWLGELTLRAADGEATPASGLVLPGSVAEDLLDDRVLAPVSSELLERWGPDVLAAVGVRDQLAVVVVPDVLLDRDAGLLGDDPADPALLAARGLDGWDDYLDELAERLGAGVFVGDLAAVADLDAVRDDAWPGVLAELAADPALRRALLDPVRAEGAGTSVSAPSYTAWWLRTRTPRDVGLGEPFALPGRGGTTPGSAPADGGDRPGSPGAGGGPTALLRPAPDWLADVRGPDGGPLDAEVLRALGGVAALTDLDAAGWTDLLDSLGPVGTRLDPAVASALWHALARAAQDGVVLEALPERLPAVVGPGEVRLVHADDAVVPTAPMWLQRTDVGAMVPAPSGAARGLAALLDLPLCDDLAAGRVAGAARDVRVRSVAGDGDGSVALGGAGGDASVGGDAREEGLEPRAPVAGSAAGDASDEGDEGLEPHARGAGSVGGDAPGESAQGRDGAGPVRAATPEAVLRLVPAAPAVWWEHEDLHVDGAPVDWWVDGEGPDAVVHATHLAALARGLAQAAGAWGARHALEIVLTDAGRGPELVTEAMLDAL